MRLVSGDMYGEPTPAYLLLRVLATYYLVRQLGGVAKSDG